MQWCDAVCRVGELAFPRRFVLLLHITEHDRIRRHRAQGQGGNFVPGSRTQLHILLHVLDAGNGSNSHVLQPHARGSGTQS